MTTTMMTTAAAIMYHSIEVGPPGEGAEAVAVGEPVGPLGPGLPEGETEGLTAAPTATEVSAHDAQYELLPWKVAPIVNKPCFCGVHANA